jgi:hypothetical protein
MLVEFVLFFNPFWKYRQRHPHVFEVVERSGQVEVFYVKTHVFRAVSAEDAVPQ